MKLIPCAEAWLAELDPGLRDFWTPYFVDFLGEYDETT